MSYPHRPTIAMYTNEIPSAIHWVMSVNPNQAKLIKADPSNPMKSLSPLVVSMGRNPLFKTQGDLTSQMAMIIRVIAIVLKNIATGVVQTIHSIILIITLSQEQSPLQCDF